ncbi:PaaI family thioesterase [Zavarzinia compransoris]|uniref:PaaI family thioesterase n=1 Tax=Zavarzinia marina TaxID=2911065 RepID=UPI001F3D331F|nr:PaaI family thioesterase [Zavarzinia marina]MCF4165191.1 PaaI family thioesterase [Zavarzinia marina]
MDDAIPLVERLRTVSELAGFNRWLEVKVATATAGEVEIHLANRPEFGQYSGFLHAAVVAGLIEIASGFAAASVAGNVIMSQFSVRCLRPAVADIFVARGTIERQGRQQIFAKATLGALEGEKDRLFAAGEAILLPVGA